MCLPSETKNISQMSGINLANPKNLTEILVKTKRKSPANNIAVEVGFKSTPTFRRNSDYFPFGKSSFPITSA